MKKPRVVILTTHFGSNYSGGSTATHEIFQRLEPEFEEVIVIGTEIGQHRFSRLKFIQYRTLFEAARILKSIEQRNTLFYGDFYNAYLYALLKIPFYFTYHDNWPELGNLSLRYRLQYLYFWNAYRLIFRAASHVFVVSEFKLRQVQAFTASTTLVRNGCSVSEDNVEQTTRFNALMVGNIDTRKYRKAIELFGLLADAPGFHIDIYGHTIEPAIADQLKRFSFVRLKGFVEQVPYSRYRCLLHTSLMENLSLVWCEATARATPILSFNVGGAAEFIDHDNGVLIAPYNLPQMKAALMDLIQNPLTVVDGRRKLSEYSWDSASRQYSDIILKQ